MTGHWRGVLLVVLLAVVGFGFVVTSPEVLFNRHSDLVSQAIATQTVLHDSWVSGEGFPLWRDDQLSGGPAFTNPQAAYSHPLHAFFAFFPPARVVGVVVWLELFLAAIGAYLAAAALKLSMPGRVLTATGVLFSFKTILAVYAGWLPVLAALMAMPFVFAAVLNAMDRPSIASAIRLALATALALHAGHPQLTYYAAFFAALLCLDRLIRERRANPNGAGRMLASLSAGVAFGLGISAYRLLPIAADLPLVTRSDTSGSFGSATLAPAGLLTVFYPEYFGTPLDNSYAEGWEYILYLGVVPTLLASFGFVAGPKRPNVTALRVGLLLSAALALDSPLVRLVSTTVPGYGLFRMPARVLFLTAFFGYCLAGVGLDELLSRASARRKRVIAVLLVTAVALEGSFWVARYIRGPQPMPFPTPTPYLDAVQTLAPARIAPLSTATPNYGVAAVSGLRLVTGYDPYNFRHYQTYMDLVQHGHPSGDRAAVWYNLESVTRWDLLDALNVGIVVSPVPLAEIPPGYRLSAAFQNQPQFHLYQGMVSGPVYVYRNERRLQHAFFVPSVRSVTRDNEMIAEVIRSNLRDEAVVVGGPTVYSQADPDDRVEVRRAQRGVVELTATSTSRRFLVISEIWHPGWRAIVDGEPRTLHRADIALQGLWLEPGTHDIRLSFWPVGLSGGLIVTGVTSAAMIVCFGLMWASRQRTRGPLRG